MKKLLIIVLLFTTIIVNAQYNPYTKHSRTDKWIPVAVYVGSMTLNGLGDGLIRNDKLLAGYLCNAVSIGSLIALPLITNMHRDKYLVYIISVSLIRYSMYNPMFNLGRTGSISYMGNNVPDIMFRTIAMGVGVSISLTEL